MKVNREFKPVVESGVAMPSHEEYWPFKDMKVGDSFEYPGNPAAIRSTLYIKAKLAGKKISVRSIDDTKFRVWVVA